MERSDFLKEFIDKTAENDGTKISRRNLMAIQGFIDTNIVFMEDGSIVETNSDGETLTTTFNGDGTITEELVGDKKITKTTTFNDDGSIMEVVQ